MCSFSNQFITTATQMSSPWILQMSPQSTVMLNVNSTPLFHAALKEQWFWRNYKKMLLLHMDSRFGWVGGAQGLPGQNNTMSSKGCWEMWPSCCSTTSSPWRGIHLASLFRNAPSTLFSLTVKPDGPDQLYTTGPTGQNLHLCSA